MLAQALSAIPVSWIHLAYWKFWVQNEKNVSLKSIGFASVKLWDTVLPGSYCINLATQYLSHLLQSCWMNAAKMRRTCSNRWYIKCSKKNLPFHVEKDSQLCCVCISKCKFSVLLSIAFKGFSDKIEAA